MSYQQAMYDRDHPRYSEPTEYITMEVDGLVVALRFKNTSTQSDTVSKIEQTLHFRNRFQTMPCILYRVLQHTAATSHIEKPNTLSGRRVVHERQMRRATY